MIYIDASRYQNTDKRTGVENYSYCLIKELVGHYGNQITLVSPRIIDLKKVKQLIIPFPRLWTQVRLSFEVLRNKKLKILFVPSHLMPLFHPKKTIITIHDVAFKRYPKSYSFLSRLYLNWGAKFAVKRAHKIIVPSEITKNDLVKFYGADSNKITVIPLGFSGRLAVCKEKVEKVLKKFGLKNRKYFLFVGRIESKKNIKTLLTAFAQVNKNFPDYQLVLAGKPGVGYEEIRLSNKVKDLGAIETGYVSDEEKWALMDQAFCFVFPSLFEGFGIPLLEAMSANLPVIASDIPSSKEVMEKDALYFPPLNVNQLAGHMEDLIKKPSLQKVLIQNYKKRLSKFTWAKAAKQTWEVLTDSN